MRLRFRGARTREGMQGPEAAVIAEESTIVLSASICVEPEDVGISVFKTGEIHTDSRTNRCS